MLNSLGSLQHRQHEYEAKSSLRVSPAHLPSKSLGALSIPL